MADNVKEREEVWVGRFPTKPYHISEHLLIYELFREFKVETISLPTHIDAWVNYVFVTLTTLEEAQRAIIELDDTTFQGHSVSVQAPRRFRTDAFVQPLKEKFRPAEQRLEVHGQKGLCILETVEDHGVMKRNWSGNTQVHELAIATQPRARIQAFSSTHAEKLSKLVNDTESLNTIELDQIADGPKTGVERSDPELEAVPNREGLVKQSRKQPEGVRMRDSAVPPRGQSKQRKGQQALEPISPSQKRRARRRQALSGRKSEQSQSPAKLSAICEMKRIDNVLQTIKAHAEELKRQREQHRKIQNEAM